MADRENTVHLKSPGNWINDPNGFIYYRGEYHLFYQHFPYAPQWGRMHWGHAVSRDLTHWEHKGIALFPSKRDDRSGCFSGSAVASDDRMYLYYTGVNYDREDPENINVCLDDRFTAAQLMIVSEDGYHFDNLAGKSTVIPPLENPEIGCRNHTRDPKVWRGKEAWYMVLGSTARGCGRLLFYKSRDLYHWEYVNHCEKKELGRMWECPDYFETEGGQVLLISPLDFIREGKDYHALTICFPVEFDEESCTMVIPGEYQLFDCGQDLYAPQSTLDERGNRVVIAWARMPQPVDGKWSGMFCIPRIVEIREGHIYFRPHPNVAGLFTREISHPSQAGPSGYKLVTELENGEKMNIGGYVISRREDRIMADRSAVFAGHDEIKCRFETPPVKEGSRLDIYVDRNLIEVYINNGEYVLSNTVYGLADEIDGKGYGLYTIAEGGGDA